MTNTTTVQSWPEASKWERSWHGNCINSYNEETKQYIYARCMGMDVYSVNFYGQRGWDFGKQSVLDIGCGPYSMLLKSKAMQMIGIDPCSYPSWVEKRYEAAGVQIIYDKAENLLLHLNKERGWDEVLLYNCLQHTENPELIVKNMRAVAKTIRVFEWVDAGISPGHLHDLKESKLNEWLGGVGKVEFIDRGPVVGKAYYGIFKGNHYEKH